MTILSTRRLAAVCLAAIISATPTVLAAPSGGGGGGFGGTSTATRERSPEQQAENAYKSGVRHIKKAQKHEVRAADAAADGNAKKQEKFAKRATKEWEKATQKFIDALSYQPRHAKAYNELGFALRKQGRWQDAVAAYDRALALRPAFAEAIEYRGEAYLGMDRLTDAREAYMQLFREHPDHAATLLRAMQEFVEANGERSDERFLAFASWVAERTALAAVTLRDAERDGSRW